METDTVASPRNCRMLPLQLQRPSVSVNRIGQSMLKRRIIPLGSRFWYHHDPSSKLTFPVLVEGHTQRLPLTVLLFTFLGIIYRLSHKFGAIGKLCYLAKFGKYLRRKKVVANNVFSIKSAGFFPLGRAVTVLHSLHQ
jgi:hypothetical protein